MDMKELKRIKEALELYYQDSQMREAHIEHYINEDSIEWLIKLAESLQEHREMTIAAAKENKQLTDSREYWRLLYEQANAKLEACEALMEFND